MKLKKSIWKKFMPAGLLKLLAFVWGTPIKGWTYEKIKELDGYPISYEKLFATDDDSNGPLFFLRALEDGKEGFNLTSQAVGEALLNYAPYEHGFFGGADMAFPPSTLPISTFSMAFRLRRAAAKFL